MKVAVFGVGGIGGIVGAALARVEPETTLIARGRGLEALRRDGLLVRSPLFGDLTVRPPVLDSGGRLDEAGVMDAVIVTCKGYDLEGACRALAPAVRADTLVVPLLNGVVVSEFMEGLLPPCILADGTIRIFSHLEGPGRVVHSSRLCRIVLGMRDGSRPPVMEKLAALLNEAGIETSLTEDILTESWSKYMQMGSTSIMCCYYDGPVGKAREDPKYEAVLWGVLGEMSAVAAARGVRLSGELTEKLVEFFWKSPPDTITSLYRDLSGGKPADRTELDHIIGRMVGMGREAGVPTPYCKAAYERFASR